MYRGLVDRFVIDEADAELAPAIEALGMEVSVLPTVMRSDDGPRPARPSAGGAGLALCSAGEPDPDHRAASRPGRRQDAPGTGPRPRRARSRWPGRCWSACSRWLARRAMTWSSSPRRPSWSRSWPRPARGWRSSAGWVSTPGSTRRARPPRPTACDRLVILHGDLPNLAADDVRALVDAAADGAGGRHRAGSAGDRHQRAGAETAGRHRLSFRHRLVRGASDRGGGGGRGTGRGRSPGARLRPGHARRPGALAGARRRRVISLVPLEGIPEIRPGDDLAEMIAAALAAAGIGLSR